MNDVSQIRRLQLIMEGGVPNTVPNVLSNAKKLRRIFCQEGFFYPSPLSNKHLRVVHRLGANSLKTISSPFKFHHLRYLDLSYSNIKVVHATSISQLYNLQTLNLNHGQSVEELLNHISSLNNLRHLDFSSSDAKVVPDSVMKLTNLQALDISGCTGISVLPIDIGSLQNLSSLNISETKITELPDSVCSIYNLKRFNFMFCKELKALPSKLGALTQLRSLNLLDTRITELPESLTSSNNYNKLEIVSLGYRCKFPKNIKNWVELKQLTYDGETNRAIMPRGIEMLTCMEVLTPYLVRKEISNNSTSSIQELANLNSLREIWIMNLENVRGGKIEAEKAKLKHKKNIQYLFLRWEPEQEEEDELFAATMVLEGLQPHPNLESLSIQGFPGLKPPKWMGSSSCLPNLVELNFYDCRSCGNLVALGQLPCLRVL
ncbi:putative disease resistance protein RGA3 [Papaver somniferum]|uniref:putative disease resistance protein RGA3 n=1 Tax=Papaver somniferum TaxID=3469 RepID=UPI000E6F4E12|nr:putative disease resistance protein RGA3 [Papaver somniferum]